MFFLPTLALLGLSAWLGRRDLDLAWERRLFNFDTHQWQHGKDLLWFGLYQFGTLPAILVGVIAIFVLLAGLVSRKFQRYGKGALYLTLSIALGCGLLSNVLFKDHWGRPRPSQLQEFGGSQTFAPPLVPHFGKEGKSFPCGHATTGFCFASLGLLLWKSRRRLALGVIAASAGYGILIGLARMAQGSHFASDVAAAAAVCWASSAGLYLAMDLYGRPRWREREVKNRPLLLAIAIPVALLLVGAALMATPYHEDMSMPACRFPAEEGPLREMRLESFGDNHVDLGMTFEVNGEAHGFGMPRSRVKRDCRFHAGTAQIHLFEHGWFTELDQKLRITVPATPDLKLFMTCPKRKGTWDIDLVHTPGDCRQQWTVKQDGDQAVAIHVARDSPVSVIWKTSADAIPQDVFKSAGGSRIQISVECLRAPEIKLETESPR